MELRTCNKCNNLLHLSAFRKDRQYVTYTCHNCYKIQLKKWRATNKLRAHSNKKNWAKSNPDKVAASRKKYAKKTQVKIASCLRNRLLSVISGRQKVGSAIKDLGCSIEHLKNHLESKFQPSMSWENHTIDGWHIDHVKTLCSFDLSDYEQLKKLVIIQIYNHSGLKII